MAFPKVGNMAPAFSLLDQDGNKISLGQFKANRMWPCIFTQGHDTGLHRTRPAVSATAKALARLDTVCFQVSPIRWRNWPGLSTSGP